MEEFPVALRLKVLIEALGLSDSQFADACGISRSTLSLILSGKNKKISDVMLSQIHTAFPKVNIIWLLFGEGNKFQSEEKATDEPNPDNENLKFPNIDTSADDQLNLVSLKQLENIIQDVVNKSFNSNFSSFEILLQNNQEKITARKISKITVYYDDSKFETFIPEN